MPDENCPWAKCGAGISTIRADSNQTQAWNSLIDSRVGQGFRLEFREDIVVLI